MKVKEHKVGERFEMFKLIYEIKESPYCDGCALLCEEEGICLDGRGRFEHCCPWLRQDNKSIIFIKVGEADD